MTETPTAPAARTPARRLSPLTPVVRGPIFLLAVVAASWQDLLNGGDLSVMALLLLGALVLGGGYGVLSWLRTQYWVDDDELRVDTGVLSRNSRRIRVDRLQGVDIRQPVVARLFGLAELRFDVAGGDREASLAFLPLREAHDLRTLLLQRRDLARGEPISEAGPAPERLLARLDPGLLVASLVVSGSALAAALTVGALLLTVLATGATWATFGIGLPALLGFAFALGNRLVGFYNFVVTESPAGLHVRRGLLTLSSQTIALHRIQGVVVSEPLMWRWFGWARLDVSLAGYRAGDADEVQASPVLIPVAPRAEALALARHVLAGPDPESVPLAPVPRRARWLAPLTWRTLGFGMDEHLLVSRRGWLTRRTDVAPQPRVQSLRLTQGPLQRRLRLARLHVDSPPGPVRVRAEHRDPVEARALLERAVTLGSQARATQVVEVRPPDLG